MLNAWKCSQYFDDSVFNILIPQTVDQGVQHGDNNCVKHRAHLDCESWVLEVGHTKEEENGAMEDGDSCQVGSTGGESFVAPTGRIHLQDGNNN